MAEVQTSAPLVGDPLTDVHWRGLFGDEAGVFGDTDGSAYRLNTPTGTEVAQIGSSTIDSISRVAGFMHRIPAGQTQSLEIPPSTHSTTGRTDLIVVRYNPTTTDAPGPCRLHRVAGVEGSATRPTADTSAPGVEDLPLYAVTRRKGQSLTEAAVVPMGSRIGPQLWVPSDASLPTNAPVGTRARRGSVDYAREMVGSSVAWVPATLPSGVVTSAGVSTIIASSWSALPTPTGAPAGSDYNLRTTLVLPARARVRLRAAAWMQVTPTGGTTLDLRMGVVVTGATPTSPEQPTWSGVAILISAAATHGYTGVAERVVDLNAGGNSIGIRAYRDAGAGAAKISYPELSWRVEEWL